jgi:uncharacterized protein VirK/YbjX
MKINLLKLVLSTGQAGYPVKSVHSLVNRIKFLLKSLIYKNTLKTFVNQIDEMGYSQLFHHEIPLLVVVHCPYLHNNWGVETRFCVILEHYQIIKKLPVVLNLVDAKPRIILDLAQYSPATYITLDKAKWFVREGEVVLNLFKEDQRLMSIAFTFAKLNDELVIYIGALQGRLPSSETLEMLKEVSKCLEGLRPADFLLEVLRVIAKGVGVKKILAISDENRHHRHKYFGKLQQNLLRTNYNEKWKENQGVLLENGFYSLPIIKCRRDIADIASNKRAIYRRRYEMLDRTEIVLKSALKIVNVDPSTMKSAFPITVQQKAIDLNPENTVLAQAMFDIAINQIKLGEFSAAKKTLQTIIKKYPKLTITAQAKKRLNALEVVKAIEGVQKIKRKKPKPNK